MNDARTVVVFLATGLQGTALIEALSAHNTPTIQWNILALTRDTSSSSARRLAALPGVTARAVKADYMDHPAETLTGLGLKQGEVHGIFSNQAYVDDKTMIRQGNDIADAAKALGVKHLVYSSVDTGGMDETGIASFEVKRTVENHIKSIHLPHTFLRPVQFMENFLPTSPFMFKMGRTVVMRHTFYKHPERKHQLISVRDIGRAGAKAFVEGPEWMGGTVRLAGDGLTVKEIDQVFREELGEPVQLTFDLLAKFVKAFVPIVRDASKFWDEHGFNVDINALRAELPEIEDLRTFLRRYKAESQAGA